MEEGRIITYKKDKLVEIFRLAQKRELLTVRAYYIIKKYIDSNKNDNIKTYNFTELLIEGLKNNKDIHV